MTMALRRLNEHDELPEPLCEAAVMCPERLSALTQTRLLDTDPEPKFDRITRMASRLLQVPVSLISLVDRDRQFFKSCEGLCGPMSEQRETPLSHSFCKTVVANKEPLVIEDARQHAVLSRNPAIEALGVIAYLGVPVCAIGGEPLGALCVIDHEPRSWSDDDLETLRDLAAVVEAEIALIAKSRRYQELANQNATLAMELHHRVKNTMAIASALVGLSAREGGTVSEVVLSTKNRLASLARAHDTVIGGGGGRQLSELVDCLLKPFSATDLTISASGDAVWVGQRQVTPICLILHELATNSAKYGALRHAGSIKISWAIDAAGLVTLIWRERAPEIETGKLATGVGAKVVTLASQQLNGKVDRVFSEGQLEITFQYGDAERGS